MNYCWFWLIAESFRLGLIDKQKVASLWRTAQELGDIRNTIISEGNV